MRRIVIGDIHGCSKALMGLLDAISPKPDDLIVFLGDYVDRGPDSRGVIDRLLQLRHECQTVFLQGNHDIMFRGAIQGLNPKLWLQIGGATTLTSYGGELRNVNPDHIAFLAECRPYYETDQHLFVHANYLAELPMVDQPEETLYWEHLGDRIPAPHISGKHVYLGHTPQPLGRVGFFGHFTCLDTGCFADFWLTGLDIDSGEVWQVSKQGHLREKWKLFKKLYSRLQKFGR